MTLDEVEAIAARLRAAGVASFEGHLPAAASAGFELVKLNLYPEIALPPPPPIPGEEKPQPIESDRAKVWREAMPGG